MKDFIHSKAYLWTIALCVLITCYNGSMVTNTADQTVLPDINFYGMLEDHAHKSEVEYILIGGKYESIPFYQQIINNSQEKNSTITEEIDPKQNKTLINLQDIKSITLANPHKPTASTVIINNKTYVEIIVETVHHTKKKFLVESSRKITCKEVDKSSDLKENTPALQNRDLNFMHVKKLSVKGHKSRTAYQAPQLEPLSSDMVKHTKSVADQKAIIEEKNNFKNNAAELITAIEENVKNLPLDNASAFETMRSTILTLLKSLRDQLQKFLDMIK